MDEPNSPVNPGVDSLLFKPGKVSWATNVAILAEKARFERLFIQVLMGIVSMFLLWATFAQKAVVVDATGEIVAKNAPLPLQSTGTFTIRAAHVTPNQAVTKGQLIVESTRMLSEKQLTEIRQETAAVRNWVDRERDGKCDPDCRSRLMAVSASGPRSMAMVATDTEFYRTLADFARDLKTYQMQVKVALDLPATIANFDQEIRKLKRNLQQVRVRRAEKALSMEVDEMSNRLANLEAQRREKELNAQYSLASARNALDVSLTRLEPGLVQYQTDAAIRAPISGTIAWVEFKGDGQVVHPGQTLFLLHAGDHELQAKLKLSDADIAKIKVGSTVRLDLNSYRAYEFGIQYATVSEIPEKPPADPRQAPDPAFVAFAELRKQSVTHRDHELPMRAGMNFTAKVIIQHERLIVFFFKKLLSIKDDYLGTT